MQIGDEKRQNPFGNSEVFNAYFRWVTKDNVPSLLRMVESDQQRRHQAMRALGTLKDERAVDPLARRLDNFFDRQHASDALAELGPIAENAVLKFFNHQDNQTRTLARTLLQQYQTKSELLLTQCLTDLDSPDGNRRAGSLQWIAKAPVDAKRKTEVSKALNRSLDEIIGFPTRDLMTALESWGTSENIPSLSKLLTRPQPANRDVIRILGKMQDPEATRVIAEAMGNFFNASEARKTLREMGGAAEPAVIAAMAKSTDTRSLRDYAGLLGEIGTRKLSLPALTALSMRVPQDFLVNNQIQQSAKAINSRAQ